MTESTDTQGQGQKKGAESHEEDVSEWWPCPHNEALHSGYQTVQIGTKGYSGHFFQRRPGPLLPPPHYPLHNHHHHHRHHRETCQV